MGSLMLVETPEIQVMATCGMLRLAACPAASTGIVNQVIADT
jgi:hypothetical protein